MGVREKLVELLGNIYLPIMDGLNTIGEYTIPHKFKEKIADYLISNDVTVQKWIPVTERLPQKDGYCLVTINYFGNHQGIDVRYFAKDGETVDKYDLAGQKDVWCSYDSEWGYVSTDSVTHWMPLPELPKGE